MSTTTTIETIKGTVFAQVNCGLITRYREQHFEGTHDDMVALCMGWNKELQDNGWSYVCIWWLPYGEFSWKPILEVGKKHKG